MRKAAPHIPDPLLLKRLSGGDTDALASLMDRHEPRVFDFVFRIVKSIEIAEEITQDVFIKLWETRQNCLSIQSLPAWLFTSSRNRAINILQETASRWMREDAYALGNEEVLDIEGQFHQKDMYELVDSFAERLPPKRKEIFMLRFRQGLTVDEIGNLLDLSPFTVKNQLQKSYDSLRFWMKHIVSLLLPIFFLTIC